MCSYWIIFKFLIFCFSLTCLESANSRLFFSEQSKVKVNYKENAVLIFFSNFSSHKDLSLKSCYVEIADTGENVAAGGREIFNGLVTNHFGKRTSAAVFDATEKRLRAFMVFVFDTNLNDNVKLIATALYRDSTSSELKSVKAAIQLEVLGGPIQCGSPLPSTVTIDTRGVSKLETVLCGHPAPNVTWYISDKKAASSYEQVGKSKFKYTLYLSNVKPSMCGTMVTYVAKGYKDGSAMNGSTSLNVISKLTVEIKENYRVNSFCLKVAWEPVNVGSCSGVDYDVQYLDKTGVSIASSSHKQGDTKNTFCQEDVNVVELVQVRAVFNSIVGDWRKKVVSDHKPKEVQTQKQVSTASDDASDWVTWAIVGGILGGLLVVGVVVSLILYCCSLSCVCCCGGCKRKKGSDSMASFDVSDSGHSLKPKNVAVIASRDPELVYSNSRAKNGHESPTEQQFFDPREFGMDSIGSKGGKGASRENLNYHSYKPSILI